MKSIAIILAMLVSLSSATSCKTKKASSKSKKEKVVAKKEVKEVAEKADKKTKKASETVKKESKQGFEDLKLEVQDIKDCINFKGVSKQSTDTLSQENKKEIMNNVSNETIESNESKLYKSLSPLKMKSVMKGEKEQVRKIERK